MPATKALKDDENATLRALVRSIFDAHFSGKGSQTRFAKATGISQAHVSKLANEGKGGGIQSLRAVAKYRPVEVVKLLGIQLSTLIGLWEESDAHGVKVAGLPEGLRRAARAAVELWGYLPDETHRAAMAALSEPFDHESTSEMDWLIALRGHLPKRSKSGLRRKV